jgi:hypothetical protein
MAYYNPRMRNSQRILLIIMTILVVGAAGAAYYFYDQYSKAQAALKDPTKVAQQESKALTQKVSQLIDLPNGEDPTIATVIDPEKLKDQEFFKSAQKDDKVLIYTKEKKAFLYRPSSNRIVNVAPVNIGETQPGAVAGEATTSPTPTATPTVSPTPRR